MLDIVVLAAGKGTRMKSNLPTVLHPVAGRPLLQHVLDTARSFAGANLHVVIGHGAELVEQRLAGDDVQFVMQAEQLGTGHAVQMAAPALHDDSIVLILYGDVPLIKAETLNALVATVDAESMGLLTVQLDDPTGYGRIVRNHEGMVSAIVEQKDAKPDQLTIDEVNTGVMAMRSVDLQRWLPRLSSNNAQQEYYLTDVIALAQQEGVVINTVNPDSEMEVLGVNNRQQQAELERYYQEHLAEQLMVDGVTLIDPTRFDCRGSLKAGHDVEIDINCVFEGDVSLGNNVKIGPNCVITNSTIGDGTVIKANSILEDAAVADQCDIGPFARLRPGTNLASKAKIGNFVETKKANIGVGSKVNHLTYIGDAEIGEGANIGAGTITCNYDGVNKSKTEIGDGAFIGSNSSLVAPVKIGAGAVVGAGSTVAKDVDNNQLAVARGKQRNIDNWPKPEKRSKEK